MANPAVRTTNEETRTPLQMKLDAAVRRYHRAAQRASDAFDEVRQVAVEAMDAGVASERGVSDSMGVDRNTVRAWRGKTRVR